jgi:glucokinase
MIVPDARQDSNVGWGKLEAIASGWAIGAYARECLKFHSETTHLAKLPVERITAREVGNAAGNGDTFAVELLLETWHSLADVIRQVIVLLCPRRIVIGGGVSLIGEELFFAPLRELVAEQVFAPFRGLTDIVPAALGEEVVVHGALAFALQKLGS